MTILLNFYNGYSNIVLLHVLQHTVTFIKKRNVSFVQYFRLMKTNKDQDFDIFLQIKVQIL
jgi:hypothetical protein